MLDAPGPAVCYTGIDPFGSIRRARSRAAAPSGSRRRFGQRLPVAIVERNLILSGAVRFQTWFLDEAAWVSGSTASKRVCLRLRNRQRQKRSADAFRDNVRDPIGPRSIQVTVEIVEISGHLVPGSYLGC
jgi:hypothetical protein